MQVSASLAALIGFLGLWKLDRLHRAIESHSMDLRDLVSQATGTNPPWVMVLELAQKIVNTPTANLPEYQRPLQLHIQTVLDHLNTIPSEVFWLKATLAVFLFIAMIVFFIAFCFLVNVSDFPNNAYFRRRRNYIYIAGGFLAVSTLVMIGMMAKS